MGNEVHLAPAGPEEDRRPLVWLKGTGGPLFVDAFGRLGNLCKHGIRADGSVFPSVLLQGGAKESPDSPMRFEPIPEWHAQVVLDGWDGGERPES